LIARPSDHPATAIGATTSKIKLYTSASIHQITHVRLSFTLKPELYRVLKSLARERETTLNRALHELLQRAIASPSTPPMGKGDLPKVHGRRPFTSDDVYSVEKENG